MIRHVRVLKSIINSMAVVSVNSDTRGLLLACRGVLAKRAVLDFAHMLSSSLEAGGDDRSTFGKIPHHNQFCALHTEHWNHEITVLLTGKPREPSEKAEKARKPRASSKRGANPGLSTSRPRRTRHLEPLAA